MILSPNIVALLIVESLIIILATVIFYHSFLIAKDWDFNSFSNYQYRLEKSSFLVSVVIFFIAIIKILILPYFIYIIDDLSDLLTGAMCGVGVINANEFGNTLLIIKLATVFLAGFWIVINKLDLNEKTYPFMKLKIYLYFFLLSFILLEDFYYVIYFTNINFETVVECCSVVFSVAQTGLNLPFGISINELLVIFFISSIMLIFSLKNSYHLISIIMSIFFLVVSIYSIIYFFSTYVYEIPTHQCPFCLFQKGYNYVGYLIFATLISGTYISIYTSLTQLLFNKKLKNIKNLSLILLISFIIVVCYFPISYYIKNGVFL